MAASKQTKQNRVWKWVFWTLSFICNFGLVLGFFIYGLVAGAAVTKYTMCLTGLVGMILAIISALGKYHWRTPLVIVVGALYFVVEHFAPVLLSLAVAIILDEMIFNPLYLHFKAKTMINKEIDTRIGV